MIFSIAAASSDTVNIESGGISPVFAVFMFLIAAIGGLCYYVYQENMKRGGFQTSKPHKKMSKKKLERERRELRSQPLE